jgi:hypothetical protein
MKRIVLQVGLYLVVAVCLVYLAAMSSQEIVAEPAVTVPYLEEWSGSGHADAESEAFRHWDEDDPKVVSESCAKCHSGAGFQDFRMSLSIVPGRRGKKNHPTHTRNFHGP